jgi:hypothetical protein
LKPDRQHGFREHGNTAGSQHRRHHGATEFALSARFNADNFHKYKFWLCPEGATMRNNDPKAKSAQPDQGQPSVPRVKWERPILLRLMANEALMAGDADAGTEGGDGS